MGASQGEEKMYRTMIGVLIIACCIGIPGVSEASGFRDVLDVPAVKSCRGAEKHLLFNGIVLAGKRLVSVAIFFILMIRGKAGFRPVCRSVQTFLP